MLPTSVLKALFDFLLPSLCVVCDNLEGPLCPTCLGSLPWLADPVCDRCGAPQDTVICAPGTPLEHGISRCATCQGRRIPFRRARASLAHRGETREVVHALKYGNVRALARPVAQEAVAQWPALFASVDAVTFVPLTLKRQAGRGYNQAEVLARAVAAEVDAPCRPWLAQDRATDDQIGLDVVSRRANVSAAYRLRAGLPESGGTILLVDDVFTTGATAETCAALLRTAGWRSVHVWTLARVVRGKETEKGRSTAYRKGRNGR